MLREYSVARKIDILRARRQRTKLMRTPIYVLAASDPLLPIRILAVIALIAVIAAFVHVLRHLKQIERRVAADNLVPELRGPRNNMVLIVCAIPIIVVGLLVFLIANT